jgi:predicted  nucleic acid-binding Zn-ribbon protein
LTQQQALLEAQEQKLTSAAKVIQQEQLRVKDCQEKLPAQEKMQTEIEELEAANKQLEEERNKILTEAETLHAQVIGLERIVEERSGALDKTSKELENCKLNNDVLIGKIAQQIKPEPKKGGFKSKIEQQPEQKPVQQPVQQ